MLVSFEAYNELDKRYYVNLDNVAYLKPHHVHEDVTVVYFAIGNENGLKYIYVKGTLDEVAKRFDAVQTRLLNL